jgi:hypothetical protein
MKWSNRLVMLRPLARPALLGATIILLLVGPGTARATERTPDVLLQLHVGVGFTAVISTAEWNRGDLFTAAMWFGGPGLGVWFSNRPTDTEATQWASPIVVLRLHGQVGYISLGWQGDLGSGVCLRRARDRLFLHGGVTFGHLQIHYFGAGHLGGYVAGGAARRGVGNVEAGFELKLSVNAALIPLERGYSWASAVDVHPSIAFVVLFGRGS